MSETNECFEQCPACGDTRVTYRDTDISFPYVIGNETVEISARVPQGHCATCGLKFTDSRAERIKHDATCLQLGLLTSEQVEQRRRAWGMSRQRYAEVTKIGEASLSRWERGASVQSGALDQLLYLLGFSDNMRRLLERETAFSSDGNAQEVATLSRRFPSLKNIEHKRKEALSFKLRVGERH